ncbi:MAG TPA: RDD family protein [Polyangiales bacterium]|nr:RDD family protein [Polyangiales bacterium]
MRDVHAVRTPENVSFEFELAGLTARALAVIVDICVMSMLIGLTALTCAVFGVVFAGFARALYFVALFAIQWGYGAVLEWRWHGQTVGKRLAGTRVLSSNGLAITFGQAALRNLLRIVDILPGGYLLGGVSVLFDSRARRLGDIAADTLVVRVQRDARLTDIIGEEAASERVANPAFGALEISALERDVMRELAQRREQLPLSVRYALFTKLARRLEQRLDVRRPEFQSDERFVLDLSSEALSPTAAKARDS